MALRQNGTPMRQLKASRASGNSALSGQLLYERKVDLLRGRVETMDVQFGGVKHGHWPTGNSCALYVNRETYASAMSFLFVFTLPKRSVRRTVVNYRK